MHCTSCNFENQRHAKFCTECGASLSALAGAFRKRPLTLRGFVASSLNNWYVAAILCGAALLWTASTLAGARTHFNEAGWLCGETDFACYYTWAYAMANGVNPYTSDLRDTALKLGVTIDRQNRADYPPTFLLCFEPLTLLPFDTAYWMWTGLNIAALLLALALLLWAESGLTTSAVVALVGLALIYEPIRGVLYMGQPHTILLAMMVVASLCFRRGKDGAGGLILAIAGLLKVYPLFLVGYLLLKHRWRAVFFTAFGLVLGAAATSATIGIPLTLDFGRRLTRYARDFLVVNHLTGDPRIINIDAFVSRAFWQITGTNAGAATDWARHLLVSSAQITLLGLSAYATAVSRTKRNHDQSAFALWIVTAVLLTPPAWVHYMVLLLFLFAILAAAAIRGQASSLAIWLGLASFLPASFLLLPLVAIVNLFPAALTHWFWTNWWAILTLLAYASAWQLTKTQSGSMDVPSRNSSRLSGGRSNTAASVG